MPPPEDPRFRGNRSADRQAAAAVREGAERLQKVLADAGVASRRDCEFALRAGRIRINGRTVRDLPCWVRPGQDLVEFDGQVVDVARRVGPAAAARVYLAVHKPSGVISTARDPHGRPDVVGLVPGRLRRGQRLYPVGRLDADSTGLMLLTNDGDLTHRLIHPRFGIAKTYRVGVQGTVDAGVLDRLRRGVFLADAHAIAASRAPQRGPLRGRAQRATVDDVRILKSVRNRRGTDFCVLSITLHEGRNREIRRVLARVGLKVRSLERTAIGPLRLRGLKPGAARELLAEEVLALREACGRGSGVPSRVARRGQTPAASDPDGEGPPHRGKRGGSRRS